jgi:hypothetical protein
MRKLTLMLVALVAATPGILPAQDSTDAPKVPKPAKALFAATTPITIKLTADFKATFKNRDTTKSKKEWFPATLSWVATPGDSGTLAVEIETRGHYRLKPGTCAFPGLRVRFQKDKTEGTIWKGQGAIKLGTHCKTNPRYLQIPLQEYSAYRIYNALTDSSFRARLANATYIDTGDANKSVEAPAFFIEDDGDMAGRLGAEGLKQTGATFDDLDPNVGAMLSIFEYMVGNTDWSLPFLHNIRLFRVGITYVAVPYDFDWSGLVDAPYAFPDYRLGTKSVTERVWRGPCISKESLDQMVTFFNGRKEAIYKAASQEGIDPKLLKDTIKYLDEFFKMLNDPYKANGELRVKC